MEIWDTGGQERYRSLAPMYYRNSDAVIIAYDIGNHKSFEIAKEWVEYVKEIGLGDAVIAIVGTKLDVPEDKEVTRKEVNR